MLDDDEYKRAMALRGTSSGDLRQQQFGPVFDEYERITGTRENNINALYHHVISLYGPPCSFCGKPLRTPRAKVCGFCGRAATDFESSGA